MHIFSTKFRQVKNDFLYKIYPMSNAMDDKKDIIYPSSVTELRYELHNINYQERNAVKNLASQIKLGKRNDTSHPPEILIRNDVLYPPAQNIKTFLNQKFHPRYEKNPDHF